MQKINCDVNNCSHNKSGICYSNRVDIASSSYTDNDPYIESINCTPFFFLLHYLHKSA